MTRGAAETNRVRLAVSAVEALVHVAAREFDDLLCPDGDRRHIERIAALLGAAATAAEQALEEIDRAAAPPAADRGPA
jgi:hypothetical protein